MERIKEALLEVGTYNTDAVDPEFIKEIIPTAIALWRGKIVAVEWFKEDYGYFWDDENIVPESTIIKIM